jgi:hypothetical protein
MTRSRKRGLRVKRAMTRLGKGREARKARNKRRQPSPSLVGRGPGGEVKL